MRTKPVRRTAKRREPKQLRARQTVEVTLDAVVRVIKRHGIGAVTTNRIAEAAGVSIGSVYQYFPDKGAIFLALHERHVDEVSRLVESTLVTHAGASLEVLVRALLDALVDAHAHDPELYELLLTVPRRTDGARDFAVRLRGALQLAIGARARALTPHELDRVLFVVTNMIDSLSHAAVLRRPPRLSLAAAKEEGVRAIVAYLRVST
jgi:AcrR family transcriptional regulator